QQALQPAEEAERIRTSAVERTRTPQQDVVRQDPLAGARLPVTSQPTLPDRGAVAGSAPRPRRYELEHELEEAAVLHGLGVDGNARSSQHTPGLAKRSGEVVVSQVMENREADDDVEAGVGEG